jgi:hypothetical protein
MNVRLDVHLESVGHSFMTLELTSQAEHPAVFGNVT